MKSEGDYLTCPRWYDQ